MNIITILLIAVGLSFDTFAVSVSSGLTIRHIRFLQAVKIAFTLAVFQSLMPLIGWFLGNQVSGYIANYDHWVAFGLLSVLGLKMAYESLKKDKENSNFNPLNLLVLLGMAVATSIDALVIGVSFALVEINIYWSILVIGVVTFLVSMVGMLFGKKVGGKLGKQMEIIGGLILIGIGIKILLEHLQ
jgi:putative Mn2+ efflux pump MntP